MEWSWASSALFSFTVSSFLLSLILSISCGLTAISNMTYNIQQFRKCTNSSEWITLTVTPRDPALVCADRLQQMLLCYNHHDDDADVMPLRWLSVEFSLGLWSFTRWEKSGLLVSLLWTANREEKTADIAEMSHKFGWWSSSRPGDEAYCVCVDSARSLGWWNITTPRSSPHTVNTFLLQTSFYKMSRYAQMWAVHRSANVWKWLMGHVRMSQRSVFGGFITLLACQTTLCWLMVCFVFERGTPCVFGRRDACSNVHVSLGLVT